MNDNTVYLTGEKGFDPEFVFAVQGDALVFDAAGSDAFPHVKVADAEQFVREDPASHLGHHHCLNPRQPCRLSGNMVVGVQCVNDSYSRIGLPPGRLLLAVHRAVGLRLIARHLTTLHHAATALALLTAHLGSIVLELVAAVRAFAVLGSHALFHAVQDQVGLFLRHRAGFNIPMM